MSTFRYQKYYLNVPFIEKDEVKKLGAMWDPKVKRWYYLNPDHFHLFQKWNERPTMAVEDLSEEQQDFIHKALSGQNILVDACIGSGKTTVIQTLCKEMEGKKILYLTYNKLLKVDAQAKLADRRITVQNYHGYACSILYKAGISCGLSDSIQIFLQHGSTLRIPRYDLIVIDEYQDIETEGAEMLKVIKQANPDAQLVAVGDMAQKIYDKTTLDVEAFVKKFLGTYTKINFTQCFRISEALANRLGHVWKKEIHGVNSSCVVEQMPLKNVVSFLGTLDPGDILCLGPREGAMIKVLNRLEEEYPDKYNKKTVYASIKDEDRNGLVLNDSVAIFTTYDSCKGLERKVCLVFDFSEDYWNMRFAMKDQRYEILRNIFCVAASRGKERIIFVQNGSLFKPLSDETWTNKKKSLAKVEPFDVSSMFSFKYVEDVEDCMTYLKIRRRRKPGTVIHVPTKDGLIDISPCVGIFQEVSYFKNYDIDSEISYRKKMHPDTVYEELPPKATLQRKILHLARIETGQKRYEEQVDPHFVTKKIKEKIHKRLSTMLKRGARVQGELHMEFQYTDHAGEEHLQVISGRMDAYEKGVVYELKFVGELEHTHFLQCACYMLMGEIKKGVLWNVKNNECYEIRIADRDAFFQAVIKAITKREICGKALAC